MKIDDGNTNMGSSCGNLRLQRLILRLAAVIQFTALPGALLPRQGTEKLSWLMGLGQPPIAPLLIYMAGGCAFVYLAEGVILWMLSNDVARYRPLVIASGWIYLVGGPAFLWIDTQARLPYWWTAMDSVSCLILGATLLWACHKARRRERCRF